MQGGDTFLPSDINLKRHLIVIISAPESYPQDDVVVVNFTSYRPDKERVCVLKKGDHPFVKHDTVVNYSEARPVPRNDLAQLIGINLLLPNEPVSAELLTRMREGAAHSKSLPGECRKILIEQGLIEE